MNEKKYQKEEWIQFWCDGEVIQGVIIDVFEDHLTVDVPNGLVRSVRKISLEDIIN